MSSIYEKFLKDLKVLFEGVKVFSNTVPLSDMIRYFTKDPYYKLVLSIPRIYLKEFFVSTLKIRFLHELDSFMPEIRKQYIEMEIDRLFKNRRIINFQNYRDYSSVDFRKLGLPSFSHIKSLVVLNNYMRFYYRELHQDAVKILEKSVPGLGRVTKDRLAMYSSGIEDLMEKIKAFDSSMSSDAEDGKVFQKLRFSIASDPSLQKTYQAFILQKDKQAESLISRGSEVISGLRKVFYDILNANIAEIQTQLKTNFFVDSRMQPLSEILELRVAHLDSFDILLSQLMKLERL